MLLQTERAVIHACRISCCIFFLRIYTYLNFQNESSSSPMNIIVLIFENACLISLLAIFL